jgi:hypothetical protein
MNVWAQESLKLGRQEKIVIILISKGSVVNKMIKNSF